MESKAKIGKEVKSYPKIWTTYQKINEDDSLQDKELKEFYNSLLCDRKPYFFRHLYKTESKKYSLYYNKVEFRCYSLFDMTFKELQRLENKTPKQIQFLKDAENKNGFINSDCELNRICKYIENIDFHIKQKIRDVTNFDYSKFISQEIDFDEKTYKKFVKVLESFNVNQSCDIVSKSNGNVGDNHINNINTYNDYNMSVMYFHDYVYQNITSNGNEIVNFLIKYFYEEQKGSSKTIMWKLAGDIIYNTMLQKHTSKITIPKKCEFGDINFLHNRFNLVTVDLKEDNDDTHI